MCSTVTHGEGTVGSIKIDNFCDEEMCIRGDSNMVLAFIKCDLKPLTFSICNYADAA
jgi:hypothetical protein